MTAPSIIDIFHRQLHNVLAQQIDDRMVSLARGAAASHEEYRYQVGYIQALNDVIGQCHELERQQYGTRPGAEDQEN